MLVKTNIKGFLKDPDTGAVVNNNFDELDRFLAQRQQVLENIALKNKIAALEADMQLIKQMILEQKINV